MAETRLVRRQDYTPPNHFIDSINLEFDLLPAETLVTSTMAVRRNPEGKSDDLELDFEDIDLVSLSIDGAQAMPDRYSLRPGRLILHGIQTTATVVIVNHVNAAANKELSGLYMSNGNFMTQCEAQGFRRITYYPDRPDVMSVFTVTMRAARDQFPVLLSNGNLVEKGDLPDGRIFARWEDPFRKPCYLFALVAGRLSCREETYRLANGKDVLLQIWTEPENAEKSAWALESIKHAIAWDESRFGLELDLDRFMIVATSDFNMGAMENKGLNIFNTKCVIASPESATDGDFARVERVVGHEYFHNWTGDRVTCRDWFQLTLKEGLTTLREQEFAADMLGGESGRAVSRVQDVRVLRAAQFPEDSGPMAHPIRPDSYQRIDNFYTTTVYDKGAEVYRMLMVLFGKEGFAKGLSEYIARNDGKAATCEDFFRAMCDANGRQIPRFMNWYSQAGTPHVQILGEWNRAASTYTLTATQATAPTPGQPTKTNLLIPIAMGLLGEDGKEIPLRLKQPEGKEAPEGPVPTSMVLELSEESQSWVFTGVHSKPIPSLLRGFSAPVVMDCRYSDEELAFLAAHDTDAFNRWNAIQSLMIRQINRYADAIELEQETEDSKILIKACESILNDETLAPVFKAEALRLPGESVVADSRPMINPETVHQAHKALKFALGRSMTRLWYSTLEAHQTPGEYSPDPASAGHRALKNLALSYLMAAGEGRALLLARGQFDKANCLTDRLAALGVLVNSPAAFKQELLEKAAEQWAKDPLLMDKWFALQASASAQDGEVPVLERVRLLMEHPAFALHNPNKVYSLLRTFFGNMNEFHRPDGSGYQFWVEMVLKVDSFNPMVAARLARALDHWRRFTPERARRMHAALRQVASVKTLSVDTREIVEKALAAA